MDMSSMEEDQVVHDATQVVERVFSSYGYSKNAVTN
jgi:hypothetical protein